MSKNGRPAQLTAARPTDSSSPPGPTDSSSPPRATDHTCSADEQAEAERLRAEAEAARAALEAVELEVATQVQETLSRRGCS